MPSKNALTQAHVDSLIAEMSRLQTAHDSLNETADALSQRVREMETEEARRRAASVIERMCALAGKS